MMDTKQLILTILEKHVENEIGLIKGAKKRRVDARRGFIDVGHPGNYQTISLALLSQAMETTSTHNLSCISAHLHLIVKEVLMTLKQAYSLDRLATVSELERWFCCTSSKHRLCKIIVRTCNGNMHLLNEIFMYLDCIPFYWNRIPYVEDVLQEIDERIRATSHPAIYELKQLRVA